MENKITQYDPHTEKLIPVTLTQAAVAHIKTQIEKSDFSAIGLNFGVKPAGCTGYKYIINLAKEENPDAYCFVIEHHLFLFVDKKSYPFVKGTEIDFQTQGLNSQFVYDNPNVKDACGCGESFNIETDVDSNL
jgi:iron-sulfur cluster assembly accessory protein